MDICFKCDRRSFVRGLSAAAASTALAPFSLALGQLPAQHRFIICHLDGGWDVLLGPDTRDPGGAYSGIDLGTELLNLFFQTPRQVSIGGQQVLWGSAMQPLIDANHLPFVTVFNGLNMNTVAHEVGRAYSYTGRAPVGTIAQGDSLGSALAATESGNLVLPNVAIGVPTFNESFATGFDGIRLNASGELSTVVGDYAYQLPNEVDALLRQAQQEAMSCVSQDSTGLQPEEALRVSRERIQSLHAQDLVDRINLNSSSLAALREQYGFGTNYGEQPLRLAATAAQLVIEGVSSAVTIRLQSGLDQHAGWAATHPFKLLEAFDALAKMLTHLRESDPMLQHTTVVVTSEFSRTPKINGSSGRDHWFANSMLVFGSTLKSKVFGATNEQDLGLLRIDRDSGLPDPDGVVLKPEHAVATLFKSLGVPQSVIDKFRVEVLESLIQGGG